MILPRRKYLKKINKNWNLTRTYLPLNSSDLKPGKREVKCENYKKLKTWKSNQLAGPCYYGQPYAWWLLFLLGLGL